MVGQADLDGKKVEDVAKSWIDANEGTWKKWAACGAK
jgi:ABC-type proline/glycine betaine transport system substrate-binding protein